MDVSIDTDGVVVGGVVVGDVLVGGVAVGGVVVGGVLVGVGVAHPHKIMQEQIKIMTTILIFLIRKPNSNLFPPHCQWHYL